MDVRRRNSSQAPQTYSNLRVDEDQHNRFRYVWYPPLWFVASPRVSQLFNLAGIGCHGHGVLDMAVLLGKCQLPWHGHPEVGVTVAPNLKY